MMSLFKDRGLWISFVIFFAVVGLVAYQSYVMGKYDGKRSLCPENYRLYESEVDMSYKCVFEDYNYSEGIDEIQFFGTGS